MVFTGLANVTVQKSPVKNGDTEHDAGTIDLFIMDTWELCVELLGIIFHYVDPR